MMPKVKKYVESLTARPYNANFRKIAMDSTPLYLIGNPPFMLCFMGLLIGLTSGIAFQSTLQQTVRTWMGSDATAGLSNAILTGYIKFSYIGIMVGVFIFLGAGVGIFGFPAIGCYGLSLVLTLGTGALLWRQLSDILTVLETEGSKGVDLEELF